MRVDAKTPVGAAAGALVCAAVILAGCNFYTDFSGITLDGGAERPPDIGVDADVADLVVADAADIAVVDTTSDVSDASSDTPDLRGGDASDGGDLDGGEMMDAGPPFLAECIDPPVGNVVFVAPDGDPSNPGTRAEPLDPGTAVDGAQPGDEIVFLSGTYVDAVAPPSGTAAAPIVLRADVRHEAVFDLPQGNSLTLRIDGVSNVAVEGFKIVDTSNRWVGVTNSTDVTVSDLWLEAHDGVGVAAYIEDSQRVTFEDNYLWDSRKFIVMDVENASDVRLLRNFFGIGASAGVRMLTSDRIVMRGNVVMNPAGAGFLIDQVAGVLVEDNIITSSIEGPGIDNPASRVIARDMIMRRNRFVRNWGNPLGFNFAGDSYPSRNIRLYHNVFALNEDESYVEAEGISIDGGGTFDDVRFYDNLFSNNGGSGLNQLRTDDVAGGASFDTNHFWDDGGAPLIWYDGTARTVAETETEYPTVFTGNEVGDPTYESSDVEDFQPGAQSPLVDAGRPRATVTAGTSGTTTVEVDDPWSFYDGMGIPGERGDLVAIGTFDNVARVVAVDTASSILELDRALDFTVGDAVSRPWSGAAPDTGVFERGDPPVGVVLSSPRPMVGESVTLIARLPAGVRPVQIEWRTGDGSLYCEESPRHVWTEPGNFGLRMTVVDSDGAVHSASEVVRVFDAQTDPTSLDFALSVIDEVLCDGTAQNYTGDQTGLTAVGPKSSGAGYDCVAP